MPLKTFSRQLDILLLLADNRSMNVQQVADHMHMGRRQIYRYIELLQAAGFEFQVTRGIYRLKPSSHFYRQLRQKFSHAHSPGAFQAEDIGQHAEENFRLLLEAIRHHRQVIIRRYHSLNSHTVSDRLVEPYYVIEGDYAVRCHEVETRINKTFRISRMERVEVLPSSWQHEDAHVVPPTDMFGYSSDTPQPVTLRLTQRAYQILREEYGADEANFTIEHTPLGTPSTYLLSTFYCHQEGIGRFVMGLPADVEVIGAPSLLYYIRDNFQQFLEKNTPPALAE